jgi:hypothetical protein
MISAAKRAWCASGQARLIHGLSHSGAWQSWKAMHNRCQDVNHPGWHRYGGRGIKVCMHWNDFENFFADMGHRPPGKTLDRINNDGNYEPSNCRWATRLQQMEHKRNKKFCSRGHEWTEANTYFRRGGRVRNCRTCRKLNMEQFKLRRLINESR